MTQLGLGALVKDGKVRCVFPCLDSYVAPSGSDDGTSWRNWGLCSQPLATVWLDSEFVPLQSLQLSAYYAEGSGGPDAWAMAQECVDIRREITALVELLADPPAALLQGGFQLVTVPVAGMALPAPGAGARLRLYLTDFPEPRRLLELDGAAAEAGFLEVTARIPASGADSSYLPEVYRSLYAPA